MAIAYKALTEYTKYYDALNYIINTPYKKTKKNQDSLSIMFDRLDDRLIKGGMDISEREKILKLNRFSQACTNDNSSIIKDIENTFKGKYIKINVYEEV